MKLDKTKPFGTVHGDSNGAFEQDGVLFDAQGDEIIEPIDEVSTETHSEKKRGRPPLQKASTITDSDLSDRRTHDHEPDSDHPRDAG